jgi:hypothetical protein
MTDEDLTARVTDELWVSPRVEILDDQLTIGQ